MKRYTKTTETTKTINEMINSLRYTARNHQSFTQGNLMVTTSTGNALNDVVRFDLDKQVIIIEHLKAQQYQPTAYSTVSYHLKNKDHNVYNFEANNRKFWIAINKDIDNTPLLEEIKTQIKG